MTNVETFVHTPFVARHRQAIQCKTEPCHSHGQNKLHRMAVSQLGCEALFIYFFSSTVKFSLVDYV